MSALQSWRQALRQEIHSVATRFGDELDTPYYGSRAGSWVREAREAADGILAGVEAESWGQFCAEFLAGVSRQAECWRGADFSDPDGFGGSALTRFAIAVDAVKDDDFATACDKMAVAAQTRQAKPLPHHDVYPVPPEYLIPAPPSRPERGGGPPLCQRLLAWWRRGRG